MFGQRDILPRVNAEGSHGTATAGMTVRHGPNSDRSCRFTNDTTVMSSKRLPIDSMTENATRPKPSIGNRILDTVIGLGAMLILLPVAPFILLLWLWDRFKNREKAENELEP